MNFVFYNGADIKGWHSGKLMTSGTLLLAVSLTDVLETAADAETARVKLEKIGTPIGRIRGSYQTIPPLSQTKSPLDSQLSRAQNASSR